MKALHYNFLKKFWLLLTISGLANLSEGQEVKVDQPDKEVMLKNRMEAHQYVFKAESAHPARGRIVYLNSQYDLAISSDTVNCSLPYFGRAYSAPMDGRGGGITFTSINFEYDQKVRKKGGWDITITPKDVNAVREMTLTVFRNGSAYLRVFSNNMEVISFNGYLSEK